MKKIFSLFRKESAVPQPSVPSSSSYLVVQRKTSAQTSPTNSPIPLGCGPLFSKTQTWLLTDTKTITLLKTIEEDLRHEEKEKKDNKKFLEASICIRHFIDWYSGLIKPEQEKSRNLIEEKLNYDLRMEPLLKNEKSREERKIDILTMERMSFPNILKQNPSLTRERKYLSYECTLKIISNIMEIYSAWRQNGNEKNIQEMCQDVDLYLEKFDQFQRARQNQKEHLEETEKRVLRELFPQEFLEDYDFYQEFLKTSALKLIKNASIRNEANKTGKHEGTFRNFIGKLAKELNKKEIASSEEKQEFLSLEEKEELLNTVANMISNKETDSPGWIAKSHEALKEKSLEHTYLTLTMPASLLNNKDIANDLAKFIKSLNYIFVECDICHAQEKSKKLVEALKGLIYFLSPGESTEREKRLRQQEASFFEDVSVFEFSQENKNESQKRVQIWQYILKEFQILIERGIQEASFDTFYLEKSSSVIKNLIRVYLSPGDNQGLQISLAEFNDAIARHERYDDELKKFLKQEADPEFYNIHPAIRIFAYTIINDSSFKMLGNSEKSLHSPEGDVNKNSSDKIFNKLKSMYDKDIHNSKEREAMLRIIASHIAEDSQ